MTPRDRPRVWWSPTEGMLIENTMAGGCNPVGYNSDDWFREPPSDAVELLPKETPLDPSEPWPIPLPPEPPRDRWIEATDAKGIVVASWSAVGNRHWSGRPGWNIGGHWWWREIVDVALDSDWTLRSVPVKDGEQS